MDSTGTGVSPVISLSEDGTNVVQTNGKDLIVHLNPASAEFKEVEIVKAKENASRFVNFSRASPSTEEPGHTSDRRMLCASDTRILVWQLYPLGQHAEIENVEPGALNVDFGGDEKEIIVFHAWNTKVTIFSLDTGRTQVIKTPKSCHPNSFGYRPQTRQFAILLKPDANDVLTIHEFRSYELVGQAILPTVDAQGLKWSPDGKWVAIWDTASMGTKVLVYTADGQLYRTYSGPADSDISLDLGVRCIEWGPASSTGLSEYLAVGKVNGSLDLLNSKTFTCSISLTHVSHIDQYTPSIWREQFSNTEGDLEYIELGGPSAVATLPDPTGPPRGVCIIAFSADGSFLATVDQTRPNIVWTWRLGVDSTPGLDSVLVHEHPVRQIVWHPSMTALLFTTANTTTAAVHYWTPQLEPMVVRVPVPRSESGKYDVRWLSLGQDDDSRFWFGTPEDYVLGVIEERDNVLQIDVLYSVHSKVPTGSLGR